VKRLFLGGNTGPLARRLRTYGAKPRLLVCCLFVLLNFPGPAGLGSTERLPGKITGEYAPEAAPTEWYAAPSGDTPETAPADTALPQADTRSEIVMKALAAAYPDRLSPASFVDGDWSVEVLGVRFFYAQGRLLPAELRSSIQDYDPQSFYSYPAELPPWSEPSGEDAERLQNAVKNQQARPPKRSQHFYDALWRARTREESYDRLKTIRFLSRNLLVHYAIMEELALVEERILAAAKTDAAVQQWINSLDTISSWNWRSIADTQSRSFHAYGAAIDLLPKSRRGLETYWLWTAENNPRWWAVPYERRFHPPDKVIKAFEAYGFIWGGKWRFYDTMHFEYRPEILLLNNMEFLRS
jgi:hypothetical protein